MATTTAKRKKVTLIENVTAKQAETALKSYKSASDKHDKILKTIERKTIELTSQYAEQIKNYQDEQAQQFAILQHYATNNRDAFGDKKSMDLPDGKIGFRTSTPALVTLPGFTWASVTILLQKTLKTYVKTSVKPLKDKLLADRDLAAVKKYFPKCGIAVSQTESFFVEPKTELEEA